MPQRIARLCLVIAHHRNIFCSTVKVNVLCRGQSKYLVSFLNWLGCSIIVYVHAVRTSDYLSKYKTYGSVSKLL